MRSAKEAIMQKDCPNCHENKISFFRRMFSGDWVPVNCENCGAKLVPSGWITTIFAISYGFIMPPILLVALLTSWWAFAGGILLFFILETIRTYITPLSIKKLPEQ